MHVRPAWLPAPPKWVQVIELGLHITLALTLCVGMVLMMYAAFVIAKRNL